MSKQLSRTTVARRGTLRVRLTPYNTVAFPRALREAIPDLPTCVGRVLKLDAIDGQASNTNLYGGRGVPNLSVRRTPHTTPGGPLSHPRTSPPLPPPPAPPLAGAGDATPAPAPADERAQEWFDRPMR